MSRMAIFLFTSNTVQLCGHWQKTEEIPYNDNLCAFRALTAFQLHRRVNLADRTYELYCSRNQQEADDFEGVAYNDFDKMETFFDCSIFLFAIEDESAVASLTGNLIYRSQSGNHRVNFLAIGIISV